MLIVCHVKDTLHVVKSTYLHVIKQEIPLIQWWELIFYNHSRHIETSRCRFRKFVIKIFFMHTKLDYCYFSAFEREAKATEIFEYIVLFSRETKGQRRGTTYQDLGKY